MIFKNYFSHFYQGFTQLAIEAMITVVFCCSGLQLAFLFLQRYEITAEMCSIPVPIFNLCTSEKKIKYFEKHFLQEDSLIHLKCQYQLFGLCVTKETPSHLLIFITEIQVACSKPTATRCGVKICKEVNLVFGSKPYSFYAYAYSRLGELCLPESENKLFSASRKRSEALDFISCLSKEQILPSSETHKKNPSQTTGLNGNEQNDPTSSMPLGWVVHVI